MDIFDVGYAVSGCNANIRKLIDFSPAPPIGLWIAVSIDGFINVTSD